MVGGPEVRSPHPLLSPGRRCPQGQDCPPTPFGTAEVWPQVGLGSLRCSGLKGSGPVEVPPGPVLDPKSRTQASLGALPPKPLCPHPHPYPHR